MDRDGSALRADEFRGTDRFEVRRWLGEGGFGVVYEAWDHERRERVALKSLRRTSAHALYRFKQEFRTLADIHHPNLVTLHELQAHDDQWFFTMELVEGLHFLDYARAMDPSAKRAPQSENAATMVVDTLAAKPGMVAMVEASTFPSIADRAPPSLPITASDTDRVRAAPVRHAMPFNETRLRSTLRQLSHGLISLHDLGKLHRDIKPSNVLVARDGRVVILDFGLVSDVSTEATQAIEARVAGTPEYMSPEQAGGTPASEASDWYSAGTVLFEALTGRLPFVGTIASLLAAKVLTEAPPPSEFVEGLPPDLAALCVDLLRRNPEARPTGRDVLRRLSARAGSSVRPRAQSPRRSVPLVGRDAQLGELWDAFTDCAGKTGVALVQGRSGMGKTTLVRRFLDDLRRRHPDVIVLAGNCYEQESVPYKALDSVVDALSQQLRALPADEAEAVVPANVLALARVFPVLQQVDVVRRGEQDVLEIPDPQELRRRAFGALRELLVRLGARRRVVMFIDNLQWGDLDSAALLAELLQPPDAPAMLLVCTHRSEDAEASVMLNALRETLATTGLANTLRDIAVSELSADDSLTLARALLPDADLRAEGVAREAGGSPMFIDALARFSPSADMAGDTAGIERRSTLPPPTDGPSGLDDVIWSRTRQLADAPRRLLEIVAVAGRPVSIRVVRAAALLAGEEQKTLSVLRAERLTRTRSGREGDEIETYHDRIRESVVARLDVATLASHHLLLAGALAASGSGDEEAMALHFDAGGDRPRAAQHTVLAARRAAETLAFDRAARLYRRALALIERDDPARHALQIALGDASDHAGRGGDAAEAYLVAAQNASSLERLQLETRAAGPLLRSGRIDDGLRVLRGVLDAQKIWYAASPQQALASLLFHRAQLQLRGFHFRERRATEVSPDDLLRVDTYKAAAHGLALVDTIRGADFQTRHTLQALRLGEPRRAAHALVLEAGFASLGGTSTRARAEVIFDRAEIAVARIGEPYPRAFFTMLRGVAACLQGRFQPSLDDTEAAIRIFQEKCTDVPWDLANAQFYAMSALFWLGNIAEMRARVQSLLRAAEERSDLHAALSLRLYLVYLIWLADDDATRAKQEIRESTARWSRDGFHVQHWWALFADVQILLYAGDGLAAWKTVNAQWRALSRSLMLRVQYTRIEALHMRARAAIAGAAQSRLRAIPLLFRAERDIAAMRTENAPWSDALAHLLEAGVATLRRDRARALRALERADTGLTAVNMRLLALIARRCHGELTGGDEGRARVATCDAAMNAEGIRRPEGWVAAFAPGVWSPRG